MDDKKKKYMFIIGPVVLFITLFGLTYAFFNYTRTGTANTISTGRIYFNTSQGPALTLTNVFPMTATEAGNANLDAVTVSITGDTTYVDGEEFEISLVDVNNTINGKPLPIKYIATYTAATGGTIGTSNSDYFEDREDKDANIYLLNATGWVYEDAEVLVGYVDNGQTGISGNLTIKAYIDADRIAISDTYYGNTPTPNPSASPTATPSSPTPTPGPTDEYGTTDNWVNGRVVLTTEEWNSLSSNPVSFKIKAESNEGIWVGKIDSCPDCKFIYPNPIMYTTWNTLSQTPTVLTTGLYDNYKELVKETDIGYFLGVKLNAQNQVTNAYVCGVKGEDPYNGTPFCIEGTSNGSSYSSNAALINGPRLWNNTCTTTVTPEEGTECGPWDGMLSASAALNGIVSIGVTNSRKCSVYNNGEANCIDFGSGSGQPNI